MLDGNGFGFPARKDAVGTGNDTQVIFGQKRFTANVRIGGSSAASGRLHVTGAGSSTGELARFEDVSNTSRVLILDNGRVGMGTATLTNSWVTIVPGTTGNALAVRDTSDASTKFAVLDTGEVGIGQAPLTTIGLGITKSVNNSLYYGANIGASTTRDDGVTAAAYGLSVSNTISVSSNANGSTSYGVGIVNRAVANGVAMSGATIGINVDSNITSSSHTSSLARQDGIRIAVGTSSGATGGGSIADARGIDITLNRAGTSTVTAFRGVSITDSGSTGSPTRYGIYEALSSGGVNFLTNPLAIGTTTITANLTVSKALSASAWGTAGINIKSVAQTFTDTSTADAATVSTATFINGIDRGTLNATNASAGITYRHVATVGIIRQPAAGTNVTINNAWSLYVAAGQSAFIGDLFVGANADFASNSRYNTNLLNGSGYTGIQIRSNFSTTIPALEMFAMSASVTDGGVVGRQSWWTGQGTVREVARIEALAVGTGEDAASLAIHTMTGATLTERVRILSTGEIGFGGTPASGNRLLVKGGGTSTNNALLVQDSSATALFTVKDNGAFAFKSGTVDVADTGWTASGSNYSVTKTHTFDFTGMTATDANIRTLALLFETLKRALVAKGIILV